MKLHLHYSMSSALRSAFAGCLLSGLASPAVAQADEPSELIVQPRRPEFLTDFDEVASSSAGRSRYFSSAPDEVPDEAAAHGLPDFDDTTDVIEKSAAHQFASDSWCVEEEAANISAEVRGDVCPPLMRFRSGCYQGSQMSFAWLHDDADSGLAIRTFDTSASFAVPLGSMDNLLLFTPFFRADMLDAAAVFDVPDTLYETGLKMLWKRPINDRWRSMLAITPSVRSDFETSENAVRLFGLGLLTWQWIPERLAISGGVVYTGRDDFPVLPAAGLLWTPTPDWKLDLQFPSPRLSRCIGREPGITETWIYLAGVFGGNTWAVTRGTGAADELTLRDLRLVSGVEHLMTENRGAFAEFGCVFNRSLEFASLPVEQELDTTWMIRAGLSF